MYEGTVYTLFCQVKIEAEAEEAIRKIKNCRVEELRILGITCVCTKYEIRYMIVGGPLPICKTASWKILLT